MRIQLSLSAAIPDDATLLALPVCADDLDDDPGDDRPSRARIEALPVDAAWLAQRGFGGQAGEVCFATDDDRTVLIAGMGTVDSIDAAAFRKAGTAVARALANAESASVALLSAGAVRGVDGRNQAQALAEGLALGGYRDTRFKGKQARDDDKTPTSVEVTIVGKGGKPIAAAIERGARIAEAVGVARDLVNEPGGSLTPKKLADTASELGLANHLEVEILGPKEIKKLALGGLLGVNRGSAQEARLIKLTYNPPKAKGHLILVGKGITFDSGGLSIKSGAGMMTMKCDMGGGAAVIAAMSALSDVGVKTKVTAYVPSTDNMTGPDATRPGDVLTARNGKTIEVLNTDAEGRLILADGLSLASEEEPDAIVDVATLTGAVMAALGPEIAGLMGRNDDFLDQVREAADRAGERFWHLPLPDDYADMLKSEVADMRNIGTAPQGGALTAGLFLRNFVADGIAWAHLDIAGPAFKDNPTADHPKGGTGFAVRTLIELAAAFKKPKK